MLAKHLLKIDKRISTWICGKEHTDYTPKIKMNRINIITYKNLFLYLLVFRILHNLLLFSKNFRLTKHFLEHLSIGFTSYRLHLCM